MRACSPIVIAFFHDIVFFVLGTTASGKSTLINGLLRIDLLPTGHNATTSVLCEIKWGPAKEAVIYLASPSDTDTFDEREKLKLSLEKEEDCKTFASYVSCNRAASDSSQPVCYKVEVFLPLDFLKVSKQQTRDRYTCIRYARIDCF